MATTPESPVRQLTQASPEVLPRAEGGRLMSLDAYRGLIMFLLVSNGIGLAVLKGYRGWEWLAAQVDHVAWEGCVFWDLIQPAFTFIVGLAMPIAIARRKAQGAHFSQVFKHVAWRAFMLIVLSNFLSNFNGRPPRLQLINVLCQIAFGYFICFLILQLRFRWQVVCGAAMLFGYWALFAAFPGPDGPFSMTGNIGAVIDKAVLGYNYRGYYTTINFIGNAATILFGCWAGLLITGKRPHGFKLKLLAAGSAAGFALGLALQPFIPMVKRLWTPSFAFYSGGWVILMLMAFYWAIEVKGYRKWAFPLCVVGMNSIFIYSLSQLLRSWILRGVGGLTYQFSFLGELGAIPQNILVLCIMWYCCYWLYQRRIFFRF